MYGHSFFGGSYYGQDYFGQPSGVAPPVPASNRGLGGDDVPYRKSPHKGWNKAEWKRRVKDPDEAITETIKGVYAELTGEAAPQQIIAQVDAIVRPVSKVQDDGLRIDWAKMARNYERTNALVKLWQEEMALRAEIEDEDEVIMLLAMQ